jgi:hypothetical protein
MSLPRRSRAPLLIVCLLISAVFGVPATGMAFWWWSAASRLEAVELEIGSEKAKEGQALRLVPLFLDPLPDDAEVHLTSSPA